MMRSMALLPLVVAAADGKSDCCWCDPDTPVSAHTAIGADSQAYELVFSDEFNDFKRNFADGKDTKWTALQVGDTSNHGAAFYLPEQAYIAKDKNYSEVTALLIRTENKSYTGDSPTGETGIFMPYRSAMLQTWNKFCFTGGILEFRARQPRGAGYWPALWAFGNLGRAVYQNSNTGLWPWSYDECDSDLVLPPTDPPQRISACMDHDLDKDGLHPFQGRGATELDVLEGAVSNTGADSYAVGSVQLSPGVPPYFKPPWFGFPTATGAGSWYSGIKFGATGSVNNGWYGPGEGMDCPTGCPDALSGGVVGQSDLDTRYWNFRMEWTPGPKGAITWLYDGVMIWSMSAAAFGEYSICTEKPGVGKECRRTPPRMVPQEPMSIVMNTAIGTWNGGAGAVNGKHWPADFYIDYVRVWQSEMNVGCSPPDFPTAKYIEKHSDLYGPPVSPLGRDTCPEIYPDSAYANAAKIAARALERRAQFGADPKEEASPVPEVPNAAAFLAQSPQPSALRGQPSALDRQPSALDRQPSALDRQPSALDGLSPMALISIGAAAATLVAAALFVSLRHKGLGAREDFVGLPRADEREYHLAH